MSDQNHRERKKIMIKLKIKVESSELRSWFMLFFILCLSNVRDQVSKLASVTFPADKGNVIEDPKGRGLTASLSSHFMFLV